MRSERDKRGAPAGIAEVRAWPSHHPKGGSAVCSRLARKHVFLGHPQLLVLLSRNQEVGQMARTRVFGQGSLNPVNERN